ncbi:uncharacterized protein LOC129911178 [Episyrphus balteatus]|uniref:uncharacterized protein LOC129911178 n=1 Tax=Episyrphus balteatus TaxID=286459 RepID=UPI002486A165|nr:uncharacterized protein LOC129911178 [Episyrphus balteatus]
MKIYSVFLITTIFVAVVYAKGRIALTVQRVICDIQDPTAIEIELCSVKAINRSTTLMNIIGNYTRPMHSFMINSQLFKKSEIKYRPFLVNVTDDYCDFMSKNKGGAYLKIVWPIIVDYTNMNHPCPYYGYHYIKNLPVDEDKIPAVWPSGLFLLDVLFYEQNGTKINKILLSHVYFEIKQRAIF